MFDFLEEAGEKPTHEQKEAELKDDHGQATTLAHQVQASSLEIDVLQVAYDDGVVTVQGSTPSQQEREKILLVLGNTEGVAHADDQMVAKVPEPAVTPYTVNAGGTLSKIAKAHYGNTMKYPIVFEANQPMLMDPAKFIRDECYVIPLEELTDWPAAFLRWPCLPVQRGNRTVSLVSDALGTQSLLHEVGNEVELGYARPACVCSEL